VITMADDPGGTLVKLLELLCFTRTRYKTKLQEHSGSGKVGRPKPCKGVLSLLKKPRKGVLSLFNFRHLDKHFEWYGKG